MPLLLSSVTVSLASALATGLLVGLERERKNQRDQQEGPAGLRTFAIVALLGWMAQSLAPPWLLVGLALAIALLLAVAYAQRQQHDAGLTTEVALLLVLLLGAQAVTHPALAVGIGVVLASLLAYREDLHDFVRSRLSDAEVRDGLLLAASALVILPLVPDTFIGPYDAINLRTVWMLCVLMMAIGALGHLAIRLAGPRFGLPLAGFMAGFVSSTATVASMGERARREPGLLRSAAAAAVMSTAATMVLMIIVLAATSPDTLALMFLPLLLAAGAAFAWAARAIMVAEGQPPAALPGGRVFDWRMTLAAAAVITGVQLVSALLFHHMGNSGVLLATGISGFADVHAAAAAAAVLVQSGKIAAPAIVLPVLVAITTNTVSKIVMACISGRAAYAWRVVPGLLLPLAVLWLYWFLL
jgi:uncharacterized membrane protein (DUF4010 family)